MQVPILSAYEWELMVNPSRVLHGSRHLRRHWVGSGGGHDDGLTLDCSDLNCTGSAAVVFKGELVYRHTFWTLQSIGKFTC
jgi:hypothetical protein